MRYCVKTCCFIKKYLPVTVVIKNSDFPFALSGEVLLGKHIKVWGYGAI